MHRESLIKDTQDTEGVFVLMSHWEDPSDEYPLDNVIVMIVN